MPYTMAERYGKIYKRIGNEFGYNIAGQFATLIDQSARKVMHPRHFVRFHNSFARKIEKVNDDWFGINPEELKLTLMLRRVNRKRIDVPFPKDILTEKLPRRLALEILRRLEKTPKKPIKEIKEDVLKEETEYRIRRLLGKYPNLSDKEILQKL
jgi:hypothetical protein